MQLCKATTKKIIRAVSAIFSALAETTAVTIEIIANTLIKGNATLNSQLSTLNSQLPTIQYLTKKNGGPGPARNYGVEHSKGEYVIILDSDCVLPEGYLSAVNCELSTARYFSTTSLQGTLEPSSTTTTSKSLTVCRVRLSSSSSTSSGRL